MTQKVYYQIKKMAKHFKQSDVAKNFGLSQPCVSRVVRSKDLADYLNRNSTKGKSRRTAQISAVDVARIVKVLDKMNKAIETLVNNAKPIK